MKGKHIAFCVAPEYGHIVPTLGIALALIRRGCRVSYATTAAFAPLIRRVQAQPLTIDPLVTRQKLHSALLKENDCFGFKMQQAELKAVLERYSNERTTGLLSQMEALYADDRPDVVIHDDCFDTAGRDLADNWGIARIRHHSQFLELDTPADLEGTFPDDELIIMTVPIFFQRHPSSFNATSRFRFVGFIPEGRGDASGAWEPRGRQRRPALISATTGLKPQMDFCSVALAAFRGRPWDAVLSISGTLDRISAVDPEWLREITPNIHVNLTVGNFDIMPHSSLFIGQGGQGSTLEAIYCGVPQILVPPTPYHYSVARRVSELGLGTCLPITELSEGRLTEHIEAVMSDCDMLKRVEEASRSMRQDGGAELAADVIQSRLNG